jgi:hypothetical protein
MVDWLPVATTAGLAERVTLSVPAGISVTVSVTVDDWLYTLLTVWDIAFRNIGYAPAVFPLIAQLG